MDNEQERKRFEEWARPDSVQAQRNPETGEYTERGMSAAWAGWQAAVKAERLACAKVCKGVSALNPVAGAEAICIKCWAGAAKECETAILMRSN